MDGAPEKQLDHAPRLAVLERLGLIGAAPREGFDRLTRLATRLTGSPVALAVLVDDEQQHFMSQVGLTEPWASLRRTPLTHSFCQHVVTTQAPLVVADARIDALLATNLAIRDLDVVAYLGVPLMCESECVGSFCVIDSQPRTWDDETLAILRDLAGAAMSELSLGIMLDEQRALVTQLGEGEARYRSVIDAMSDGLVLQAADGSIGATNPAAERIFGLGADELIGRSSLDPGWHVVHEDGSRCAGEDHPPMRALATGEPQRDVVIGISTPDRGRSWISVTSEPLIDPARGATPYAVVSTFIDITERRRAQAALTHSERRHRMLVTNLPDAIVCLYDPQLRCVLAEGPMLAAQGYAPSDLIGRRMEDLVPPETVELLRPVFADALRGERRTIEYTSALSGLVYDMATIPFRDEDGEDGEIEGVFLIMRDVTERRTQEVAVRRAEADLRTYFEAATIGQAVIDGTGGILEANPALSVLFGLDRARLLGVELASLVHPADVALAQESLAGLRAGTTSEVQLQLRCMHAGGHPVHASAYAITLAPSCDGAHRFLVQIVDVTDRKRFEDQLQHLADHDPLTGLVNRRRFDQELARHVDLVRRYGADGAVILLDVDRFKQVNDTLGHNAGDRVITSVAHLLRDRLRTTDVLARLGGDEFAILLPKADRAGAEAVARSLVEAVRARMADIDGTGHGVTISLGAVVVEQAGGLTGERLLIDADLAMYAAKAAGRDGFAFRQGASSTDTHSVAGRV